MVALDVAYQARRQRLAAAVAGRASALLTALRHEPAQAVARILPVVEAGQRHTAELVSAYMTLRAAQETGVRLTIPSDPALFTVAALRGKPADEVYARPFSVLEAAVRRGDAPDAVAAAGRAAVEKLAATDLQLAQTHAARGWLVRAAEDTAADPVRIVGYRRVLTGPGPHCPLCTAASTRTYRVAELLPIHEHCSCTVEPLFGAEPVAAVGTTVRVEHDPEIGPRLMADTWSSVGPRLVD